MGDGSQFTEEPQRAKPPTPEERARFEQGDTPIIPEISLPTSKSHGKLVKRFDPVQQPTIHLTTQENQMNNPNIEHPAVKIGKSSDQPMTNPVAPKKIK